MEVDAPSPSSCSPPSSLRRKLRTTVCGCFGSSSPGGGGGGGRWRRRAGDFGYDPLSYALNFDEGGGGGGDGDDDDAAAFRHRDFSARLPHSPPAPPSRRAVHVAAS